MLSATKHSRNPQKNGAVAADAAAIASGAAIWALAVAFVVFGTRSLIGCDAYYHAEFSRLMLDDGLVIRDFPWTTCSIWSEPFFDKEWLFHVCLTPFIAFLGKFDGARTAVVCFAGLAGVCWGLLLRSLGVRRVFLGLLLILFCAGYAFPGRIVLCRPHLFSLIFLPLALMFAVKRNGWGLAIVCCLYMLSYVGAWQVVPIALIFDAARMLARRRNHKSESTNPSSSRVDENPQHGAGKDGVFRTVAARFAGFSTLWAAAGIAAGLLLSPYFPVNLKAIYLQSVLVLTAKWFGSGGGAQVVQAAELAPIGSKHILAYLPLLLGFAFLARRFVVGRDFRAVRPETTAFAALSCVYLAMTLMSQRFVEYLAPVFSVAVMAYLTERPLAFERSAVPEPSAPRGSRLPARLISQASLSLLLLALGAFCVRSLALSVRKDHLLYEDSAKWIERHVKPGALIFSAGWGDNSVLFYHLPGYRFLVMLEPYFMYAKSPRKYLLWLKIAEGRTFDASGAVSEVFGSSTIFVPPSNLKLKYRLLSDESAELAYEGKSGETVFTIPRRPRF